MSKYAELWKQADALAAQLMAGETFRSLGEKYETSGQHIRDIVANTQGEGFFRQRNAIMRRRTRERQRARLKTPIGETRVCDVCGREYVVTLERYLATRCSDRCQEIWYTLRLHLPGYRDKHRAVAARWRTRNSPDPVQVRHGQRFLAGEAEVRGRWLQVGSWVHLAATEAFRNNMPIVKLLPIEIQRQLEGQESGAVTESSVVGSRVRREPRGLPPRRS